MFDEEVTQFSYLSVAAKTPTVITKTNKKHRDATLFPWTPSTSLTTPEKQQWAYLTSIRAVIILSCKTCIGGKATCLCCCLCRLSLSCAAVCVWGSVVCDLSLLWLPVQYNQVVPDPLNCLCQLRGGRDKSRVFTKIKKGVHPETWRWSCVRKKYYFLIVVKGLNQSDSLF